MSRVPFQIAHDTAANWTSNNPTLLAGEIGFETNTNKFKIGDGSTAWTSLAYGGGSGGSGTVINVSVATANGFSGTVATATTTPTITLTTSISGVLKGNGTAISAASAGTDYVAPGGALGTPSSGTLTNCVGTATGLTSGALALNTGGITYNATVGIRNQMTTGSVYDWCVVNASGSAYPMAVPTGTLDTVFGGAVSPAIAAPSWASTMTLTTKGANVIRVTLAGATTINFSAGYDGQKMLLELKQDGTGSRVVTWGTGVQWGTSPAAPTLTTSINKVDRIALVYSSVSANWVAIGYALGSA